MKISAVLRGLCGQIKSVSSPQRSIHRASIIMNSTDVTAGLDDQQVKLLEEKCILVDVKDKPIGSATKKNCHLLENIKHGMLHRAFSVFLFNYKNELLVQQRSDAKITFPAHITNTCCSHPLYVGPELEEAGSIGVRRAAQRRLQCELGIRPEQIPIDDFHFLTRIHYEAENSPRDGVWGEHEIDYCLVIKKDVTVNANWNEVKHYEYLTQSALKAKMAAEDAQSPFTPWFKLIAQHFLYTWWDNVDNLEPHKDHATIHSMISR